MNNNSKKFVTSISPILGLDDGKYVRTTTGFIGVVKIPGIDIFGMRDFDKERAYIAFGNALVSVKIPFKIAFISCKPDFSTQKANLASHELKQKNPERVEILRRMRASYEWLETNATNPNAEIDTTERLPFLMFFSDEKSKIDKAIDRFIRCMSMGSIAPSVCEEDDIIKLFKVLLQGGVH